MDGVLIIAHGSREKQTENTFETVVAMAKKKVSIPLEIAYMEFSKNNIANGFDTLIAKGVDNIKVVPYFLFSGIHIREDIPNEIAEYLKSHEGITIKMGETLGVDERLADLLAERILK